MGDNYLLIENKKSKVYKYFGQVSNSTEVLILSRDPPLKLRGLFGRTNFKCLWLTNVGVDSEHVRPQDLEQLSYTIERFIEKNGKTTVLLMGIEYIISYTSFEQTMHFIQTIKDIALIHNCDLFVNIGQGTLQEQEKNLLEQEFEVVKIK